MIYWSYFTRWVLLEFPISQFYGLRSCAMCAMCGCVHIDCICRLARHRSKWQQQQLRVPNSEMLFHRYIRRIFCNVLFYIKILQNGLPSPENPYVFNGDFVDRGKKSLEVLLLLLACLLVFPGGIYLNRGNHEDTVMNARYTHTHTQIDFIILHF